MLNSIHNLLKRAIKALFIIAAVSTSALQAQSYGYISNSGSHTVSVIDATTNAVVATIPVGTFPRGMAVAPSGDKVYVATFQGNNLTTIDVATNTVSGTVALPNNPDDVVITPDGSYAYVSTLFGNISAVNLSTNAVTNIAVSAFPGGVAVTPDGSTLYAGTAATVTVISTASNSVVETIAGFTNATELAITPDGAFAYVLDAGANSIRVIDLASNTITATLTGFATGGGASLAMSADGSHIYVSGPVPDDVRVIDTATNTIIATVVVGTDPFGLAVTADGSSVYVANRLSANVSVIDAATNTNVATIAAGNAPWDVVFSGNAPKPEMDVQGGSLLASIPDGSTSATDFGSAALTGGTVSQTFTIENTGSGTLNLSGSPVVEINGAHAADFSVTAQPANSVAAGSNTSFTIEFNPAAAGVRTATISIANNDDDENPYDFAIQGSGLVGSPIEPFAYVTNSGSNSVSVIDPVSNNEVASIPVGTFPRGMAVAPSGDKIYVATFQGNNLTTIDAATNTVSGTVALPNGPDDVAISPDGSFAYVTTQFANISAVNLSNNAVTNIALGGSPYGLAVTPNGNLVYVSNGNSVSVISTATNSIVNTIAVANQPAEIVINASGAFAYVVQETGNSVSVIDLSTNSIVSTITGISTGVGASIALSPDGAFAYLSSPVPGLVQVIDLATNTLAATAATNGTHPYGLAVTPDGATIYTVHRLSADLSVIDVASNTTVNTVAVGNAPWEVVFTGIILKPEMDVQGGSPLVSIADGELTVQTANGTDFGDANVNGTAVAHTFTIANTGSAELILSGSPQVVVSGASAADFTVTQQPASPVAAGGISTFTVEFVPSATGIRTAVINIANDDFDENQYDFKVQGNGLQTENIFNGNITLTSQAGIDAFAYTGVTGAVTISEAVTGNITNLNGLSSLTSIGGRLTIISNSALTTLSGLENLGAVGSLWISTNASLANLAGLNGLNSVPGFVTIDHNPLLTNLSGLDGVTSIGGYLFISANSSLSTIAGLEGVTTIGGNLTISLNNVLANVDGLAYLSHVGGKLQIYSNPLLTNINGFALHSLVSVGLDVQISNNPALINLNGLAELETVGGNFSVDSNAVLTDFRGVYLLLNGGGLAGSFNAGQNAFDPVPAQIIATGPVMNPNDPAGFGVADSSVVVRGGISLLTVTVTPGSNPASSGLTVSGDLSAIGGSATQSFYDDGTNGDITAGDNIFTCMADVAVTTDAGDKYLPVSIADAEGRTGSASIVLTVQLPGSISGTVFVTGVGMEGVRVALLDENGIAVAGVDTAITDASGMYSFTALAPADYLVNAIKPLGYSAMESPIASIVVTGVDNQVDFELDITVTQNKSKNSMFWMKEFRRALNPGWNNHHNNDDDDEEDDDDDEHCSTHFSEQELQNFIDLVHVHYTPHFSIFQDILTLEDAQILLRKWHRCGYGDKATRELAALLMNMVSGKIGQYTVVSRDDRTAGEVLTYVSMLLTDDDGSNDKAAYKLALRVNQRSRIKSGQIPASNILYKGMGYIDYGFGGPETYVLKPNYPNPFNPTTTIAFELPQAEYVTLRVYSATGQLVRTLVSGHAEAGYHFSEWNGTNEAGQRVSSGLYFYRITAGKFTQTQKMLLLK